ncbi:hypothetical protein [Cryptosporangium arvum]|uniref:hypothetical protein n=1 Tax=Cryptosporangium arvum TaxID=80871 RepID=UPI00146FE893|nr:hypothetical protein [Cryptosporangium arvum]
MAEIADRMPDAQTKADAWFAGLAVLADPRERRAMAGRALAALRASARSERWPADEYVRAAPVLGTAGDQAILRAAYHDVRHAPDDGYGSSGKLIAAFAEAFASAGDLTGIEMTLSDASAIADNTFALTALTGVARAHADARLPLDMVRTAGRRLHAHFAAPWALDTEIAFSLAEAARATEALDILAEVLTEAQRPRNVEAAVAWRKAFAQQLASRHPLDAAELCQAALAQGETLATSNDVEVALRLRPYLAEIDPQRRLEMQAQGMEWERVVETNAPVLPLLAETGDRAAVDAAVDRIEDLVNVSFSFIQAFTACLGPAAEALLISGDTDRFERLIANHQQLELGGIVAAADVLTTLNFQIRIAGLDQIMRDWAAAMTKYVTLSRHQLALRTTAILNEAIGARAIADNLRSRITDPVEQAEAALRIAAQALIKDDRGRARRLIDEFELLIPALPAGMRPGFFSLAVPILRELGDSRDSDWTHEALSQLDAGDYYATRPPAAAIILQKLAEETVEADPLLARAARLGSPYHARQTAAEIAMQAAELPPPGGYPPLVASEVRAATAIRDGDVDAWRSALRDETLVSLVGVARRIAGGAGLLYDIDGGETLLALSRAMSQADLVWSPE